MKISEETVYNAGDSLLNFNYSIEQMTVQYSNDKDGIEFIINLMAIIGGVLTITKIIDSSIYNLSKDKLDWEFFKFNSCNNRSESLVALSYNIHKCIYLF